MRFPFSLLLLFIQLLFIVWWSNANSVDSITSEDVEAALRRAKETVDKENELKRENIAKGRFIDPSIISAEARHQLPCGNPKPSNAYAACIIETATRDLVERFGLKNEDIEELSKIPLDGEIGRLVSQQCTDNRPTNCNANSKYRTFDGSCTNLARPNEGRTFSCLLRLLPSAYEDGISKPRTTGLPGARDISIRCHRVPNGQTSSKECYLNTLHMSFGQFIDHDIEFTQITTAENNAPISCCPENSTNDACFPIRLSSNDPDFPNSNCMNFVRNIRCSQCNQTGKREQMNSRTAFLDCSQVYGTTNEEATGLRDTNGMLSTRNIPGVGVRPPPNPSPANDQCSQPGFPCFLTGDFRANQNFLLLLFHIIFLKFHNYLVRELSLLNPHWNAERLYQEARRIVIACEQNIVYSEYLPPVIGVDTMDSYKLHCRFNEGTTYNSKVICGILNEFGTVSFRFGHSTVPEYFQTESATGQIGSIPLAENFFNPVPMYQPDVFESLVRGAFTQPQKAFDKLADRSVTQHLYRRPNDTVRQLDLAAINIQRGRDHGFKPYTEYLKAFCNIKDPISLENLEKIGFTSSVCRDCLVSLYGKITDADLWTMTLCEPNDDYALVGPLSKVIIGEQFYRLKYGDSHFHTHQGQVGSFTIEQLKRIQVVLLSRIICYAIESINAVPIYAFILKSDYAACNDYWKIPKLDLKPWKENRK